MGRSNWLGFLATALVLGGCHGSAASRATAQKCAADAATLAAVTDSEYAFAHAAETSVRGAFLRYLAADSIVLQPEPIPGRAVYGDAKESADKLAWYPAIADVAASGDLGFTTGPWVYTVAATGKQLYGHYLTVWRRDPSCAWQVVLDGGVSHAAPGAEPPLHPTQGHALGGVDRRTPTAATAAAVHDLRRFNAGAAQTGLADTVSAFGADDLRVYVDDHDPIDGPRPAADFFKVHPAVGAWSETYRALSGDADMAYAYGELHDAAASRTAAYAQVWRYDRTKGRWRLRVLLVNAYPHPLPKS